jgi:hypothetical protein
VVKLETSGRPVRTRHVVRECRAFEPYPIKISEPTVRARLRDLGYEKRGTLAAPWIKTRPEKSEEEE